MKINEISYVAIYPPIGIARIGNSPEHFLASDLPGVSEVPEGGYKDTKGRIKKEVARFRVYGFNSAGDVVKELTADEATINWRAEVANVKAAWYEFNNALDLGKKYSIPSIPRNSDVVGGYREQLAIKPSPITISGKDRNTPKIVPTDKRDEHCQLLEKYIYDKNYSFDDGKFYGKNVNLGHLQTDSEGRLLFFAGNGGAESTDNMPITTFANNNGWHDDTCDGIIRATVKINGREYEAKPAMVAVTPPNFGQGLYGVVTMNGSMPSASIIRPRSRSRSSSGWCSRAVRTGHRGRTAAHERIEHAAARQGRDFVGYEINESYCAIAHERVTALAAQACA